MARCLFSPRSSRQLSPEMVLQMKVYEMTMSEFGDHVDDSSLAILPCGIVEEHGPHLPLGTDTIQAIHMVDMLEEALEKKGHKVLVLPPVHYGQASSTRNFPGSISIEPATLQALIHDILSELVRNGIRNFLVLSGHAGGIHLKALDKAAYDLVEERKEKLNVMVLSDYLLAYELPGTMGIPEGDGHAGTMETARVYEARPELVRKEKMAGIRSSLPMPRFRIIKNHQDYLLDGVIGEPPVSGCCGMGEKMNDYLREKLLALVQEMLEDS